MNGDAIHKYGKNQEEQILAGVGRSECVFARYIANDPRYVNRQIDL